jgi:hypothetical protein
MAQAQAAPFWAGPHPMTADQIKAGCRHVAGLAQRYGIAVTRRTILTHAEVQPTLGIKQKGKWDIRWLPDMRVIGEPVEVGDELRAIITGCLK